MIHRKTRRSAQQRKHDVEVRRAAQPGKWLIQHAHMPRHYARALLSIARNSRTHRTLHGSIRLISRVRAVSKLLGVDAVTANHIVEDTPVVKKLRVPPFADLATDVEAQRATGVDEGPEIATAARRARNKRKARAARLALLALLVLALFGCSAPAMQFDCSIPDTKHVTGTNHNGCWEIFVAAPGGITAGDESLCGPKPTCAVIAADEGFKVWGVGEVRFDPYDVDCAQRCAEPPTAPPATLCCVAVADACACFTEADWHAAEHCTTLEDPAWRYVDSCPAAQAVTP